MQNCSASLAIVVFLSACASYKDIKEMEAFRSFTVVGFNASTLSACVKDQVQENLPGVIYHRNFDKFRSRWFLISELASLYGGGTGNYNSSVSFQDNDSGVALELRSLGSVWGTPQMDQEKVVKLIKKCAKA